MPPRKPVASKAKVKIDRNKHDEKLREIQEKHEEEARLAELAAEEAAEEEWNEEECSEEEEEPLVECEDANIVGRIDLSFPEHIEEFSESEFCYPPSYYTLSTKERLLLLYVENFRHQYIINNPNRRPLVLALPNECNVQKFVCTTIRPTAFLHIPLIRNAEGCASFVADFIIYEPLEDVISFPKRLISPSTLLRRRRGNSFEMATLLCSMLIGAGFPAVVVSGVARASVIENNPREYPYPYSVPEMKMEEEVASDVKTGQKYKLRPFPDLESHLEEQIAQMLQQKADEEQRIRDEALKLHLEEMELKPVDKYHYRRSHAWVAIIDNAPWSIKPKETYVDENGFTVESPPKARFIEPSTGFFCEAHCKEYILIDSVWNQYNYYVNKQTYRRISEIRWDLRNLQDWEHILPGEPPEMRIPVTHSDENVADIKRPIEEEKHLDTIRSWVMRLHIGEKEFEERFPNLQKTIYFKRARHDRFSPYTQKDGKISQLTFYEDDAYRSPTVRWEFFDNRADHLKYLKFTYAILQFEESYGKSRNDNLKFMKYNADFRQPKELYFYSKPRIDSLEYLKMEPGELTMKYSNRRDNLIYQQFEFKPSGNVLKKIVQKYKRNTNLPADKDIAERIFLISQQKIILKFHYARGALTASTMEFIKPPKPDYGQEIIYDPNLVKFYKANVSDDDATQLEIYNLLLNQLENEEKIKKQFEKIMDDCNQIIDQRKYETDNPKLTFRIFDKLRNGAIRELRLKENADEEEHKRLMKMKPPDFLAPYLIAYSKRSLTFDESMNAYNSCLMDLKTRFVNLLNELQRQYEDLSSEDKSLKRFLNKFENQFNNYDYTQLVEEGKIIGLNKRMVQQRLTLTHEESQKKYEAVKESLLKDPRLNLDPNKKKVSQEPRTVTGTRFAIED